MANIETLFHAKKVAKFNVFLLGADSLSWLLSPGKHKIMISKELQKTWCALIPIGKKCDKILTTGLKWNLGKNYLLFNTFKYISFLITENHSLSFGELVSTSNTYTDLGYVTIDTSDCILWSMGLAGIPTNYDTAC